MKKFNFRWPLVAYDILILFVVDLLLVFYRSREELSLNGILLHGGIQCYIRLLILDAIAFAATLAIELTLPLFVHIEKVTFSRLLSIASMNLLGALAIRMIYRYCFKCGTADTGFGKFLRLLLRTFAGEELLANPASAYTPRCFIDVSTEKAGRSIHGIPVMMEDETTVEELQNHEVQEVVGGRDNRTNRKMILNLGSP